MCTIIDILFAFLFFDFSCNDSSRVSSFFLREIASAFSYFPKITQGKQQKYGVPLIEHDKNLSRIEPTSSLTWCNVHSIY